MIYYHQKIHLVNVNNELDNFLKNIDDKKIDMFISNGLKFLGE